MPRTTKEVKEEKIEKESKKKTAVKASTTKKPATKKSTTSKVAKEPAKKTVTKKATTTKKATSTAKKTAAKKSTTSKVAKEPAKKAVTKKATATKKATSTTKKPAAKKSTTSKVAKEPAKKAVTKKTTATKKATTTTKKTAAKKKTTTTRKSTTKEVAVKNVIDVLEYYDLPYRYNQTIVKVLAQTPKTLFVYWDISDSDRQSYIDRYGEKFFENTKPVLIIHNETMNYSFEIEINDFANCWYFNINDEKCDYRVELGRRPRNAELHMDNDYIYITSSNGMESPNGHILFEKEQKTLFYRNVKTNETIEKDVASLDFIRRLGRIYKIYDIYKKLYKDDEFLKAGNPSSKFI